MKKILCLMAICASVWVLGTACDKDEDPDRDTYVDRVYKVVNQTEFDVVVEVLWNDGTKTTIKPGETRTIHTMDVIYEWGVDYDRSSYLLYAEMTIGGKTMPQEIWLYSYWDYVKYPGKDEYHYSETYTLTMTQEQFEIMNGREIYDAQKLLIVNEIDSDVVVKLPESTGTEMTIKPGETVTIYNRTAILKWGVAYSISSPPIAAEMTIGGETISPSIWNWRYWDHVRLPDEDAYHFSTTYTLTVNDELLESVKSELQ